MKKWGIRFLQGFLIGLGIILLSIGTYVLFQAFQEWFINAPVYVGFWSTTQEIYQYNFVEYIMNKLIGIVPFTFFPGSSLVFYGIMIGWFSRMYDKYKIKIVEKVNTLDTYTHTHKHLRVCFNCGDIYFKAKKHCPYCHCKNRRGE